MVPELLKAFAGQTTKLGDPSSLRKQIVLVLALVHYIRDLYSNNTVMLLDGNWSDHTGAARAA